jgi:hypothetical protein
MKHDGIWDRDVRLPDSCDVVVCYDANIAKETSQQWGKMTLVGLGGRFEQITQLHPFLVGRCDFVLNDYSTAKFFPKDFPSILVTLLRPGTGVALLQDLSQRPPIIPFLPDDHTDLIDDGQLSSFHYYDVALLDGRVVRVSGVHARGRPKRFTMAQLLFRVQSMTNAQISRDARIIHAGKLVKSDQNLYQNHYFGRKFYLVAQAGQTFIEPYSEYFQTHRQYQYATYPVPHFITDNATGVWLLELR